MLAYPQQLKIFMKLYARWFVEPGAGGDFSPRPIVSGTATANELISARKDLFGAGLSHMAPCPIDETISHNPLQ